MPPQIGLVFRYDNQMADSRPDVASAPGAGIGLAGLIRLDRLDDERSDWRVFHDQPPTNAHNTTTMMMTTNTATMMRSVVVFSC